jgi:RimJ/RimL family protein N-acetyltransferase
MTLSDPVTFPDAVPVLRDGDVTLRAHRADDARAVVEQCTDPLSVRWTLVPSPYDLGMARGWIHDTAPAGWRDGSEHLFAIESTHPDGERRFSGSLSLRDMGNLRAEIAFGAHPAVRGKGVMTTAVTLLLEHGFGTLGLETVIWYANVGNVGSRRVAWKTGFTFGGTLHRWLDHRGERTDAWVATRHRDDPAGPVGSWEVPA